MRGDVIVKVAHALVAALITTAVAARVQGAQGDRSFVAIGARYQPASDPVRRRRDLEDMRRFRFTVVQLVTADDQGSGAPDIALLERLLAGSNADRIMLPDLATVSVTAESSPAEVRLAAWRAIAAGMRGVIFDNWETLGRNPEAFGQATAFAEHVTRNAALYAPLRPRPGNARDLRIDGGDDSIEAQFLESRDALVLVVLNRGTALQNVLLTFSPEFPEAIWQNMLTGASVNFVAGPDGPTYRTALDSKAVLVLMITRRWR